MGLLSKIFGSKKDVSNVDIDNKAKSSVKNVPRNENCIKLMEFASHMEKLLAEDRYIARSDYKKYIDEYQKIISFFEVLSDSGMLGNFCDVNGVEEKDIVQAIDYYNNAETYVEDHNEEFLARAMVEEKEYLDNVLKAVDPVVVLDEDQRKVVLTDEDYCLVIAGAGAGKTTTVAAKVKYLVDKKGIDPAQILVVSFTNKAVNELKEKIQDDLGVPCPIATFHSTGNAIIHKNSPEEKLNIVDNSKLYFVIRDYFRGSVMKNESVVNKLIMFFATYFDAPYEGDDLNGFFNNIAKANYSTMRSDLEDFKREVIDTRTKKSVTIQNEILRSHQEVEIANFLYLNNIEYEYEPIYQYNIQYSHKPYTPDFVIYQNGKIAYIEHFGITENGKNDRYSQDELEQYKKAINDKIKLHKQHDTTLIYTFSVYNDGKPLTEHLQEALEAKGFELKPRSNKEVMELLVAGEENRYVSGLPLKSIGRIYSFCENSLKEVRTVKIGRSDFGKANVTGFNSVYKKVIDLAKTVILGNGSNDLFGTETEEVRFIIPYTINMESLFEFYVRATIREYLKTRLESQVILDEYRIPKKNPLFTLKDPEHHAYLMNNYVPDIALIEDSGNAKRYIAVFDVKYQNSTSKVYRDTQRHNSHQLLFYMLLLNVRRCGFIFPSDKIDSALPGLNMYELNIQSGDAMDESVREYTQWMVDMNQDHHDRLAERIMAYVKGISEAGGLIRRDE